MKIVFLVASLICTINSAFADVLPKDSPELTQLEAMGYDIEPAKTNAYWTIARSSTAVILISKNSERTVLTRSFTRKQGLSETEELALLRIVNKINADLSFQVNISSSGLNYNLYNFGVYDPKTFAKVVRIMEKADNTFNTYSEIMRLIK